jgi:hypothetical protein
MPFLIGALSPLFRVAINNKKRAQCSLFVWVGGIIVACWIWDAVMPR